MRYFSLLFLLCASSASAQTELKAPVKSDSIILDSVLVGTWVETEVAVDRNTGRKVKLSAEIKFKIDGTWESSWTAYPLDKRMDSTETIDHSKDTTSNDVGIVIEQKIAMDTIPYKSGKNSGYWTVHIGPWNTPMICVVDKLAVRSTHCQIYRVETVSDGVVLFWNDKAFLASEDK